RDHIAVLPGDVAGKVKVAGIVEKAETKEIDAVLNSEADVLLVNISERAALDRGAGQGHSLPAPERPVSDNGRHRMICLDSVDAQFDQPVRDKDARTLRYNVQQFRIVDADPLVRGLDRSRLQPHLVAAGDLDIPFPALQGTGADFETGEIEED